MDEDSNINELQARDHSSIDIDPQTQRNGIADPVNHRTGDDALYYLYGRCVSRALAFSGVESITHHAHE
ncbi:hypothetical protein NEOLEDRAFT_1143992 [Neolentinus lepideus HHB14362 ss-1]|uniref:Uncharacterized protein n=1 Tax=Neolentinus lepideus HHB14362 ss-1 TaxID=1314782 RepID=A0A165M5R4_9AGAM|nr:hypothetical protein NEOLEDRAFT_1144004 [Neolentinus lepideus HHB14362 ss-1]KZT17935.1 hypothetical protein NEOLEDRAFT_1143992 [Neolentinus lepideus HHB14362 ss-1]